MSIKPIIFNTDMVRALLDGRKTQTRRPVKGVGNDNRIKVGKHLVSHVMDGAKWNPFGQVGDLLYVRETSHYLGMGKVLYKADTDEPFIGKWTPSIHMKRDYSRLTLRITDVRVERVQDISETDAENEGIEVFNEDGNLWYSGYMEGQDSWFNDQWKWHCNDPIQAFKELWDGIYFDAGNGWAKNPWVWVIEFEVIHKNVDELIKA